MLAHADPLCRVCRGAGWDRARGDECDCAGRVECFAPDAQRLSGAQRERLEVELAAILIAAHGPQVRHNAATLARAAARGSVPTVAQAAQFCRIDDVSAARVVAALRKPNRQQGSK